MLQGKLVGTVDKDEVTKDEVLAMIIIGKKPERGHQEGAGRAPRLARAGGRRPLSGRWNVGASAGYSAR